MFSRVLLAHWGWIPAADAGAATVLCGGQPGEKVGDQVGEPVGLVLGDVVLGQHAVAEDGAGNRRLAQHPGGVPGPEVLQGVAGSQHQSGDTVGVVCGHDLRVGAAGVVAHDHGVVQLEVSEKLGEQLGDRGR
jgi:hypothetical protein